jgi:hypothetical protein
MPLGGPFAADAVPACADVLRLAGLAPMLEASHRAGPDVVGTQGTGPMAVQVTRSGRYAIWLGGSSRARIEAVVDSRPLEPVPGRLDDAGQFVLLGEVVLSPGRHVVAARTVDDGWRPGGSASPAAGPLVFSPASLDWTLTTVPSTAARTLCGRRLDWIEAIR